MKQLAELLPVVLFFVVYQLDGRSLTLGGWEYHFDGIYSATAVLMIATVLQVGAGPRVLINRAGREANVKLGILAEVLQLVRCEV